VGKRRKYIYKFWGYSPIGTIVEDFADNVGHNLREAGEGVFVEHHDVLVGLATTHVNMRILNSGDVESVNYLESAFKIWYNVSDIYACPAALLEFFIARTSTLTARTQEIKFSAYLG
jgi:hypothetical protein